MAQGDGGDDEGPFFLPNILGGGGSDWETVDVYSYSTSIYFEVNNTTVTDVTLDQFWGYTEPKTDREYGENVWKDVTIHENGSMLFDGLYYNSLLVEENDDDDSFGTGREICGEFLCDPLFDNGWVISRAEDGLLLDGIPMPKSEILSTISNVCHDGGLSDPTISMVTDPLELKMDTFESESLVLEYGTHRLNDYHFDDFEISTSADFDRDCHNFILEELCTIPTLKEPMIDVCNETGNVMREVCLTTSGTTEVFFGDDSPEIFFHVNAPTTTDVTVTIPDGVTLTIPEVPMDTTATWEDVTAKADGTCTYQGTDHPYLYYEGIWEYPGSGYGWVVDREAMTDEQILDLVFKKCLDSRLEPNEAQVIIDRMVNLDMLETDSTHLAIRYIPEEDVDATMQLETSEDFHIMRRHFLIEDADTHISLLEPEFEPAPEGDLIIHETAVNRG